MARNLPFIRKMRTARGRLLSVSWDNPNSRGAFSKIARRFDYVTTIQEIKFR